MVLIVGDEGVVSEGVLSVIGDNVVKSGGNFEGVIKTTVARSNVVDRDREFNLTGTIFPLTTP